MHTETLTGRVDNIMIKRKMIKRQPIVHKTLQYGTYRSSRSQYVGNCNNKFDFSISHHSTYTTTI